MLSDNFSEFDPQFKNHFMCPTCTLVFSLSDELDQISYAHIEPKAAGGGLATYLCRSCNSRFGANQDKWYGEWLRLARVDSSTIFDTKIKEFEFEYDGIPVQGEWGRKPDGGFEFVIHRERNSPKILNRLEEHARQNLSSVTVKISTPLMGELRMIKLGLLTAIYLLWFRALGYSWVLQPQLWDFREQILNPWDEILKSRFFFASQDFSGLHPWIGAVRIGSELFLAGGMEYALVLFPPAGNPTAMGLLGYEQGEVQVSGMWPLSFSPEPYYGPTVSVSMDDKLLVAPVCRQNRNRPGLHFHFSKDQPTAMVLTESEEGEPIVRLKSEKYDISFGLPSSGRSSVAPRKK